MRRLLLGVLLTLLIDLAILLALLAISGCSYERDWGPHRPAPAPSRPDLRPCPLCGHGMAWTGRAYYCERCVYLSPEW